MTAWRPSGSYWRPTENSVKYNVTTRMATCHPDRKYIAHGLCDNCRKKKWRDENREELVERQRPFKKNWNLLKNYGITLDQYQERVDRQRGLCAVCGKSETTVRRGLACQLMVDHDHQTGVIRGLLCNRCNRAIGLFEDDPEILMAAVTYLDNGGKSHG